MIRRIVSLLPSATEIVCALGLGEQLVGRSHECDFPPAVRRLPVLTRSKIRKNGSAAEVHRDVGSVLENALGVYEVDADLLASLRPTHVLTQVQCDVCAVSLADVETALASRAPGQPTLIALNPTDLRGVFADIRSAAEALQAVTAGERLVLEMEEGFAIIERAVRDRARTPGVVCLEWLDPLMAAGNWMPQIVRIAGGAERIGIEGAHSPWIAWEDLAESDPDVILMIPCGFSIARTLRDLEGVTQRREWQALRAVKSAAVFVGDGNQYFNRPGPRLVESARIVAEILHPQIVPARHRGVGWTVLDRAVGPHRVRPESGGRRYPA